MKTHAIVLACIFVLCASVAHPIDLYVDPVSGDDSNDGLSWETALKTMTRASQLENGPGRMFLGQGVFSVESGEVFPIALTATTEIRGLAPNKTFIAVGNPAETIILGNRNLSVATICDVTFYSTSAGETSYYGWDPFVISVGGGDPYEEILHIRRVRFVGFVSWDSELILIRRHGSYHDDLRGGTRIEKCAFVDCKGTLLATDEEYQCYLWSVEISDCLIQPSQGESYLDCPGLHIMDIFQMRIHNCLIRGANGHPVFKIYWVQNDYSIVNCLFEDVRFEFSSYYGPERRLVGSSFRNSPLHLDLHGIRRWDAGRIDIYSSVFDSESAIEVVNWQAEVTIHSSCISAPILIESGSVDVYSDSFVGEDPEFVNGPHGQCYLSNINAGQLRTSACIGAQDPGTWEWYSWEYRDWPPTGSTTRTDGVPDEWPYDIGYHYPSVPPPPPKVSIKTDRAEYAAGEEMTVYASYENRGVKVEGAIYFAFGPESLEWLIYWPWMTFAPTPFAEGTLWSGVSYQNLPPTTHTIPDGLGPGGYLWLGAVISADGAFASDIALWPITITGD